MTLLDDILTASHDSEKSTADLLRMVQIVARRVRATEIEQWARNETTGYADDAVLPAYRVIEVNVLATYTGPYRSEILHPLTVRPPGSDELWQVELRQPLAELHALASDKGESDPTIPWSAFDVSSYEHSDVFSMHLHALFKADKVIPRQRLHGIVDAIRTKAVDFALDLQGQFPEAGEQGGPTILDEPDLAQVVWNITYNVTGQNTTIATGSGIRQRVTIKPGDSSALKREAGALGLDDAAAQEFVDLLTSERDLQAPRTSGFLSKVRTGAIAVTGAIATDAAADLLLELGKQFLGG